MTCRYVPDWSEPDEWSPGMPVSTSEGKDWTVERFRSVRSAIHSVLDIGPGVGTYIDLLKPHCSEPCRWEAVEVWEPYIGQYGLADKYDKVYNWDVRDLPFGPYDLVILGDVLEHMPRENAVTLLRYAKTRARYVCVSVPIIYAPQGCVNGNQFETHHYHWKFEEMFTEMTSDLYPAPKGGPVTSFQGDIVGVYWWSRLPSD